MKIGKNTLFLVILIVLSSCSKEKNADMFVGDWKLTHAEFETPKLDTSFVSNAIRSLESSYFYFQEDLHFQIEDTSGLGGSYQGNWEYSAFNETLTLFYPEFRIAPDEYDVIKLSRKKMVIRQDLFEVGILEYYLERIQ
jgi:hypothetical protein